MKHKIYELSLFLKIFYFVSKESFNIPEYRCLLSDRVLQLYTIKPAVKNIAFTSILVVCVSLRYCHPGALYFHYAMYNCHCAMYCNCAFHCGYSF